MQKEDHARFTRSMTTLVSFPSMHIRVKVKYILLFADHKRLHTINDHRDLVVDSLYIVINASHPVVDAGHLIVDIEYLILDTSHSTIDSTRGIKNLRSYYPDLFVRQLVKPLQPIFDLSLSNQLLQVFF